MQKAWSTGLGVNLFGMRRAAQAHLAAGPRRNRVEHGVLPLPIQEIAGGNAVATAVDLGPDHDDAVGLVVGQRRQQRSVDDAENRGVRADAQSQRQYRDRREARILPQEPQAKNQIAPAISQGCSLAAGTAGRTSGALDDGDAVSSCLGTQFVRVRSFAGGSTTAGFEGSCQASWLRPNAEL
jgi:hypothetical protein